jgi:hypothetical protein
LTQQQQSEYEIYNPILEDSMRNAKQVCGLEMCRFVNGSKKDVPTHQQEKLYVFIIYLMGGGS